MILIKLMKINMPKENRDFAGVQPRQDPGGTLRMNGVGERERERTLETSLDRAKSSREREGERMTRWGCLQVKKEFIGPGLHLRGLSVQIVFGRLSSGL